MGALTNYAINALLDHVLNGVAYTPPSTLYLLLCTADPTAAATGASCNEVANSGSYARIAVTVGAASSRRVTQDALAQYAQLTGSLGTASHWVIADSGTHGAGNALAYGAFATAKSLVSGNRPYVPNGEIYIEIVNEFSDYLAGKVLDLMFNNTAYTSPSTYVGLATATIASSDTGSTVTEPGGTYARVQVNPDGGASPAWNAAASQQVDNADDISVPYGAAVTVVATFVADASSAGNILLFDNALTDQAGGADDDALFEAGSYICEIT